MKYYTDEHKDNLIFYQVPKILLIGEKYKKMNANTMKLYIVLSDRIKLSMLKGWKDEKGRYYVRMSQEKGAELLGFSESTFKRAKKDLEEWGLLEQERQGLTKSNCLFVGRLDYTENDIFLLDNEVNDMLEEEENYAQTVDTSMMVQIDPSRKFKLTHQEGSKRTTSNNDFNNNDFDKSTTTTLAVSDAIQYAIEFATQNIKHQESLTKILERITRHCKANTKEKVENYVLRIIEEHDKPQKGQNRDKQSNKKKTKANRKEIVPVWSMKLEEQLELYAVGEIKFTELSDEAKKVIDEKNSHKDEINKEMNTAASKEEQRKELESILKQFKK